MGNLFGGYTSENGSAIVNNFGRATNNGKPPDSSDLIFREIGNGNSPLTYEFADDPTLVAQVFGNNTKTTILNGGQPPK